MSLNLARRPFVNARPVVRLALLLWAIGVGLAFWNARQAWTLWRGLGERRAALTAAEESLAGERAGLRELEAALGGIDLVRENERAAFLNREIDRRTFSWTRLFERLGAVLPRQVRLVTVRPVLVAAGASGGRAARRPAAAPGSPWVTLRLSGFAERDEALLDLVDTLFADPAFDAPDLQREAVPPGKPVQFDLEVLYRPTDEPPVAAASREAAGEIAASASPPAAAERAPARGPADEAAVRVPAAPEPGVRRSRQTGRPNLPPLSPEAAGAAPPAAAAEAGAAPPTERGAAGADGWRPRWVPREGAPAPSAPAPRARSLPVGLGETASATRRIR